MVVLRNLPRRLAGQARLQKVWCEGLGCARRRLR